MTIAETVSAAEAVLFACGDPVDRKRLASAAGFEPEKAGEIAELLNKRYSETGSALAVVKLGDSWQLCLREEFSEYAKNALESRKDIPLSQAALEVLTVAAYNQPVTRSFIEHVRGVDSSGVVNSLVEKNLLEEAGRLDIPGRPIAYKTTAAFLRSFCLESLDDLPELPAAAGTQSDDTREPPS